MTTRNVNNDFYGYIALEMKRFLHELTAKPAEFYNLIHLFCARISSRLSYGHEESASEHVLNAGQFIHQLGPSGPVTNLMPWLMLLPEWLVPDKREVRLRQEEEAILWQRLFDEAKRGPQTSDTYVSASRRMKESGATGKLLFENETEAKCAVGMLCTVAVFTLAGPAILFVMAMVLHPEWQDKVRAQIDQVVGDELLDLKHSPSLPMLRAAIKECLRWKTTVPLGEYLLRSTFCFPLVLTPVVGVPRLLTEDYSYDGYHFPKGGVVHVLDIAMSQDPNRYQDPKTYNPDRWLNEKSSNFKAPLTEHPRLKGHHIFGRGKRVCPGQDLAEAELFVFCGNMLKYFTLSPALNQEGKPVWPNPDNWTTDVIGGPLPFDCQIKIRDEAKLDIVKKLYSEAFAKS